MIKKIITCVLFLFLSIGISSSAQSSSTLNKVRSGGGVIIGVRENALPFSTKTEQGATGYSIDICNRVVRNMEKNLGVSIPIKYVGVNAQNRIEFLKNDAIDMECGTTTHTTSREKEVGFSYPFFVSGIRMAVRKGSKYKDYEDLGSASVAVTMESTAEKLVRNLLETMKAHGKPFTIHLVKSNDEGVLNVKNSQDDAFMTDDVLLAGAIITNNLQDYLERTGRNLSAEPYAIMVRKDDTDFLTEIDKALVPILTGGEAEKFVKHWFDTPALRYNMNHMTQSIFSVPAKFPAYP